MHVVNVVMHEVNIWVLADMKHTQRRHINVSRHKVDTMKRQYTHDMQFLHCEPATTKLLIPIHIPVPKLVHINIFSKEANSFN